MAAKAANKKPAEPSKPKSKAPVAGDFLCPSCKNVACYNSMKAMGSLSKNCGRYASQ